MAIAYSIKQAAKTAACTEQDIIKAVKSGELKASRMGEDRAVLLGSEIQKWLEQLPNYKG